MLKIDFSPLFKTRITIRIYIYNIYIYHIFEGIQYFRRPLPGNQNLLRGQS